MYTVFVILFLLSLVSLVIATIKPGTNKKTGKPYKRKDMAIGFGIIVIVFLVLAAVTMPNNLKAKSTAITKPKPTTKVVAATNNTKLKTTTTTPVSQPVSLATLNAEAVPILTTATNYNVQLMSTGQTDAAQPNALDMNPDSAFEQWRNIVDKPQVSATNTAAYNKAKALYTNSNQPVPSALTAWNKDDENAYADIGLWQAGEDLVLIDKESNTSSTSDQQVANTDYQAYQTDLSKAQTDITEL